MTLILIPKKLEKKNLSNFESNLVQGLSNLKIKIIVKQGHTLINLTQLLNIN